MNTSLATADPMDQTFDRDAADEVVRQASRMMGKYAQELAQVARQAEENEQHEIDQIPAPSDTLSLQMKVRAPGGDYALVMDDCWDHIRRMVEDLGLAPLGADASYLNEAEGIIRLRAPANLALALVQEQDYFESVAVHSGPWD